MRRGRWAALPPCLASALLLAGCGKQSTLDPQSGPAREISDLWWWMMAVSWVVLAGAVFLLAWAWRRRRREGLPLFGKNERITTGMVVLFGMVVPIVSLVALFVVANLSVAEDTNAPGPGTTKLTVEVVAHQWFWEVRYPGTPAVTANEIHIPARTRVNLVGRTADVIHSIWVPQLNRKIDVVPGRSNRVLLYADKPGRYRGQCAEFCGLQHAHMSLYVFADPPSRFRAWLANMSTPQRAPTTPQRPGEQVFLTNACSACHTIRGTRAQGDVGPDLTHLASRTTLAGLTIPNRPSFLRRWIVDPQHFKPGNKMPGLDLSRSELQALIPYLEGLR